ncbi:hypothetical protein CPB85DRAFT_1265441, partial [Mucidula mucida]
MLSVGDRVANNILQEDLEDTTSLFVDKARDTLYTTTTGETPNSGFGDALNVVAKNLPVAFSTTLSETLATFAASRHD